MRQSMNAVFLTILFVPVTAFAGNLDWLTSLLKIRALVTDRNIVESSFKKIKVIESYKNGELEVVNYKLKQGRLRVVYSGGDCGNYYDYRVAKGTVIEASFFVSDGLRLAEKNLKFNRNEMTLFVDDGGTEQYTDESNGIGYGLKRGFLDNIVIKPRKIDAGTRCDAVEDRKRVLSCPANDRRPGPTGPRHAAGQIVKVNTGDIVGEDENHNVVWQFGESTNLYDGDGEFHSRLVVTGVIPTDLIFGGIRSTVLGGQAVSYYRGGGEKWKTFVYSGGVTIACQFNAVTGPTTNDREERVYFSHADLSGKSTLWTRSNGEKVVEATGLEYENDVNFVPAELDGAGNIVGFSDPYLQPEPTPLEAPEYVGYMPFANPGERTTYNPQEPQVILDGISMSYSYWRERFQYRRFELNSYSLSRAGTPIYSWRNVSKTRDSKNGYVGDGDIIRVNTEIENYVIGWNMAFSWLGGVNLGKSLPINEKASSALNDFLKQNPGCAEVAKELGLVALNGSVTHIDVNNDEDLLNTKLKDLGWHDDPTTTQFINNQHKERTLRQELSESEGGIAVSNLGTNTVYYGTQNPTSAPSFGFVVFHELLHISVKGGHFDIAEKLGIFSGKVTEYPNGMRGIPGNADEMAAVDLFEFMKKGCKKKETEAKKP